MCKSQAEGGQRCAGHGRDLVARAQDRYGRSGRPEDLQEWIVAWTEYASTPEGHDLAFRHYKDKDLAPGAIDSSYWSQIAENGDALRARNAMIAKAVSTSRKDGDAFHKAAAARWAPLPEYVRSPAGLNLFLDSLERELSHDRDESIWRHGRVNAIRLLRRQVDAETPDPRANPNSLTPRTEAEKQAWQDYLAAEGREIQLEGRHDAQWEDFGLEGQPPISPQPWPVAPLVAFGRDPQTDATQALTSPRNRGFVVRERKPDGQLSSTAYLVLDDRGSGQVMVQPVDPFAPEPELILSGKKARNRPPEQGVRTFEAIRTLPVASLERADGPAWDKFAGCRARYTTAGVWTDTYLIESPADRALNTFAEFRARNATEVGMAPQNFLIRKLSAL